MLRYGRFHLAAGTIAGPANIVSPNSLRQMQEPALPFLGTSLQIGRDWFVQDVAGMLVFSHEGDTLGQHADFVAIPARQFALVVLTFAAAAALDAALSGRSPGPATA